MPGAFQGLNLASNALRAFQRALDVTGHNIANVNTTGYSRQRAEYVANEPTLFWQGGQFYAGNGVQLSSITRIKDMFLESRQLALYGDMGRLDTMYSGLSQVQGVLSETDGARVGDALDKFWNAWSGLASNPSERANRTAVQTAGQQLADRIRGAWHDLNGLETQARAEISDTVTSINSLTTRISELNRAIKVAVASGGEPNDLQDQRDVALRELGGLVNVTTREFEDGSMVVYMGSLTLVSQTGSETFPTDYDTASMTVFNPGMSTSRVGGGKLAGLFHQINTINSAQGQLDSLANQLRSEVNNLHSTGIDGNGAAAGIFFNSSSPNPELGAQDFDLSAAIKGDPMAIAAGTSSAASDTGLALALSRLRDDDTAMSGNRTFNRFYSDLLGDIGQQVKAAEENLATEHAVSTQIEQQIQSISGVSLDDEMANMLRYQRSYQAAARALSTFDQVTEDLINMLRR